MVLSLTKVQAIVLKSINLGESDKIITIFSDTLGKIDVVVHGARKHKSKFMASTQPFCYGEYMVFKGKGMYTLNESLIQDSFQRVLMDLEKLAYGSYFLEIIDNLTEKESRNVTFLALILKVFYIMLHDDVKLPLLRVATEFKAISIAGYMPQVFTCVKCKEKISYGYFSLKEGGLTCFNCKGSNNIYGVDEEAVQFLQMLRNIKLEDLRNIKYDEKKLSYIQGIISKYMEYHIGKEFKSLSLLNQLQV